MIEKEFNWKERKIIEMAKAILDVPCCWAHHEELLRIIKKVISLSDVYNVNIVLRESSVHNGITTYDVFLHFPEHREVHVGIVTIED